MRILIATGIFKPEVGGPATLALELAKRLSSTGHKITLITYSGKEHFDFDKEFAFKLIRVVRKENKILNYLSYFRAVLKEIKNSDIVYTLDWFSAGIPISLASTFTGKNYIVRVGGGYIWEKYLSEGKPPVTLKVFYERGLHKTYYVMYFVIKRILKNAQRVIFNSDIQRELYQKVYGLEAGKILTIYNAIPENRLSGLVQNYNSGSIERDKEIIYAGRFLPVKNVDSLVKAFARMNDHSYKLVLIGEGQLEPSVRMLVKDLGIEQRVEFLPPMSQSDLYSRIARCRVVVIPSWTDVSPNQVYECLALGIPFLVTKENFLSINNQPFLKIDPASVEDITQKLMMLTNKEKYDAFVKSLRAITFKNSWNAVIDKHLKVFMKLSREDI